MKILVIYDGDISEIVYIVRVFRGIIGMYGVLLILGLFFKLGLILIELFFYVVNLENYIFY